MQTTLMTGEQTTTGTPAYMAPEIILGEGDVDRRADVYALGCVAYFLLTGQLVFEADTPMKMLLQHLQAEPMPPSQRTELPIPRELDELVLACLEKDPAKRPQNAEEAAADGSQMPVGPESWDHDTRARLVADAPARPDRRADRRGSGARARGPAARPAVRDQEDREIREEKLMISSRCVSS